MRDLLRLLFGWFHWRTAPMPSYPTPHDPPPTAPAHKPCAWTPPKGQPRSFAQTPCAWPTATIARIELLDAHEVWQRSDDKAAMALARMSGWNFWIDDKNEPIRGGYYDVPADVHPNRLPNTEFAYIYEDGGTRRIWRVQFRFSQSCPDYVFAYAEYDEGGHACAALAVDAAAYRAWRQWFTVSPIV